MDAKKIFFALLVSALLIGSVCAASVNDFKVDQNYKNIYSSDYYSVFENANHDSGILIFKNVDDDTFDDVVNDEVLDNVVHHDGREYIVSDDEMQVNKNPDNTANFTDHDHATHGVSELVKFNGEEYIIVFWAKDSSSINNADLMSQLTQFNKDNSVQAAAF